MILPELVAAQVPLCWEAQRRMFRVGEIGT